MIITSHDNALDSLRRTTRAAEALSSGDPLELKGVLGWGWHAVALLATMVLRPAREQFDAWLWDYLAAGETALEPDRDARWEERQRLSLLELLDILSEEDAPILKPEFYQGWQDRRVRCRTLRRQVAGVVGASLGGAPNDGERDDLLFLLAAYHRLLRMPATVELDAAEAIRALPRLVDLLETLARATERPEPLLDAVAACRRALDRPE
jgi:hypothetical protein